MNIQLSLCVKGEKQGPNEINNKNLYLKKDCGQLYYWFSCRIAYVRFIIIFLIIPRPSPILLVYKSRNHLNIQ